MTACEVCGTDVDINGLCPKGCLDDIGLDPLPPRRTSRDRFGGRNR